MARPGGSMHSTKVKPTVAKPFVYVFTPRGWRIKQGENWRSAREIFCSAPHVSRPNGEEHGIGVVERDGDVIRITA